MLMTIKKLREELGPDENGKYVDLTVLRDMISAGCFPFAVATKREFRQRYVISKEGFEAWKSCQTAKGESA